jgi:hypothetical protein
MGHSPQTGKHTDSISFLTPNLAVRKTVFAEVAQNIPLDAGARAKG